MCLLFRTVIFPALLFTIAGCVSPTSLYRAVDEFALHAGFEKKYIDTGKFELLTYSRISGGDKILHVYIEGDGNAWRTRRRLSPDPTPANPLALKLAALDHAPNVVYLGRPCQYVLDIGKGKNCKRDCWSTGRFAEEIVTSIDLAVSGMKALAGAREISLTGYSGGGALAVLIAARRNDVCSLRTVAGNLDHYAFSRYHQTTQLSDSLNPADVAGRIRHIPQLHFVGGRDKIIPPVIALQFIARQAVDNCSAIREVKEAGHAAGWQEEWPALLTTPFPCGITDEQGSCFPGK